MVDHTAKNRLYYGDNLDVLVETQKAQMGVLIATTEPTHGVLDAANHGGTYTWPLNGQTFPRVQVITAGRKAPADADGAAALHSGSAGYAPV